MRLLSWALALGAGSLLATGLIAAPARAAAPLVPRLSAEPQRIEADQSQMWNLPVLITNPFDAGLYLDSLWCQVEDLDPGETRGERTSRVNMSGALRVLPSISAHDSASFQPSLAATAEHARLTLHLFTHRADNVPYALTTVIEADPGPVSRLYPSQFLDLAGRKVECVLVPSSDSGSVAGLLLVHGHASHARTMLRMGRLLAARGYTVLMVSMPGYGQSQGPADFMGPATAQSLAAALDRLKKTPGVDPNRLAAWGISRGAGAVASLAVGRNDLKAVVTQAGVYDLWATYRGTQIPGIREAIVAEAGSDSGAWRARSPVTAAEKIEAAVLILHGEKDRRAPADQAHGFYEALRGRGAQVEAKFFPAHEHALPRPEVQRVALEFLARQLKP